MQKLSAISCSLLFASSAAIAADIPAKAPAPTRAAVSDWTGFYAGVNAGYGTGALKAQLLAGDTTIDSETRKFSGGFAGGQVGYNAQVSNFVFGVEADYQKSRKKGSTELTILDGPIDVELEVPWFATARLRAGIANGPSLFYLTGGGVWTDGKLTASPVNSVSSSEKRNGWTIGAGYEAMLSPQWSWKLEYLYAKIRDNTTDTNLGEGISLVERVHDHIVRIGVNYRFGG